MWTCSANGERTGGYRILVRKPAGKRPLGRPSLGGRIILKWIFIRMGAWTVMIWLRIGIGVEVL